MTDVIVKRASRLVRYSETRDPFRIAREAGAEVVFKDLGRLKGMYAVIQRNRFIVVNNSLDDYTQRMICAHELGHDQFHRDMARDTWLREFMIFNMNKRAEYEANVFAAEILLPDDETLEYAGCGYDIEQIARAMCSDINLVAIKLATLTHRGYNFRSFESRDNFLR